ncbi:MAG TPA: PAS domain-containing protein [Pyrinomonadaceae bacterium]|nr:PAS domain-containing protein [Pyrinomonadaceae bacterium]
MTKTIDCRHDSALKETPVLFTLDLAGYFKCVDPATERLFGYPGGEMCRMNIAELVAPGYAEHLRDQIAQATAGALGAVYEIEIYNKNRDCIPLELSTRLITRDGCPFELEAIAFPRVNLWQERPRCLDEEFWIGRGLNSPSALTFIPTR